MREAGPHAPGSGGEVPRRGNLYVLSAPSGAGKTTLIRALLASDLGRRNGVVFSVSHTTRPPRPGEREGVEYHFVDRADFERRVEAGGFLEWAEVYGNLYGTSREWVEPHLAAGTDVMLDVDVQGAASVQAAYPDVVSVLVLPPSYAELEGRLRNRGLDDDATITRRLAASLTEIERYELYDYVIVNDDAERAGQALVAVVVAERHRLARMRPRVDRIVDDFRTTAD